MLLKLLKQNNQRAVTGIIFTGLLTLLASCGNGSAIESMVRADPALLDDKTEQSDAVSSESPPNDNASGETSTPTNPSTTKQPSQTGNSSAITNRPEDSEISNPKSASSEPVADNKIAQETDDDRASIKPESKSAKADSNNLPENFPASFPIYPQAELLKIATGEDTRSGTIIWNSKDNRQAIADYYQAELTANDWEIIKPFNINPERRFSRAIAIKNERRVAVTLTTPKTEDNKPQKTKLAVIYQPLSETVANSGIADAFNSESDNKIDPEQDITSEAISPETKAQKNKINSATDTTGDQTIGFDDLPNNYAISAADFTDLDNAPEQLNQPLVTVASLGILTPYTAKGNIEVRKFAPNAIITRGEYARWLITANNRYHEDDPGKKIYIPSDTQQSAFKDVKKLHPDFGAIQGLAEAGLIPSRLTEDSTNLLFRPNAPLTREDLVTWKVPLDLRQSLPKASIEAIEESWGFQDATDIDSSAIRALYADFQNGDRSNIRRVFGFTTLFQPKKPVTRAEAAASLWYFGFQGDGITAREIWEIENATESES